MTIIKITYMQTFPTGSFANIKLGAEAEVGAREDIVKAMDDLKKVVNDAFQAINPETTRLDDYINRSQEFDAIAKSAFNIQPKSEEQVTREQQIEGYYEIIKIAKTAEQLTKHWGNIERLQDLELVNAYNKKLNMLP